MQERASDGSLGLLPPYCISLQLWSFSNVLLVNFAVACAKGYINIGCAEGGHWLDERSSSER